VPLDREKPEQPATVQGMGAKRWSLPTPFLQRIRFRGTQAKLKGLLCFPVPRRVLRIEVGGHNAEQDFPMFLPRNFIARPTRPAGAQHCGGFPTQQEPGSSNVNLVPAQNPSAQQPGPRPLPAAQVAFGSLSLLRLDQFHSGGTHALYPDCFTGPHTGRLVSLGPPAPQRGTNQHEPHEPT
jgi:hypothetical protein